MAKALPYAGWALLGALLLIWAIQKFLGKWIESAASAFQEWLIGRFAARHWFRRAALRRYVTAVLEDYDKVPVPFIEREDQRPSMRKIYVPLQTLDEGDRRLDSDAYDNVRRSRRSVVLGPPGSGKSMLLKNSILIWAEGVESLTKNATFGGALLQVAAVAMSQFWSNSDDAFPPMESLELGTCLSISSRITDSRGRAALWIVPSMMAT